MTATQITFPATVSDSVLQAHFAAQYLAITGLPNQYDNLNDTLNSFSAAVHLQGRSVVTPADAEHFHSVTPAAHAEHRGEVLNKSTTERPCKRVWIIADDMLAADPDVKRKDVMAACIAAGVAFYTARTQYQQWLGVRKEMAAREAAQAKK